MCGFCGLPRLLSAALALAPGSGPAPAATPQARPTPKPPAASRLACPTCTAAIAPEFTWCPNCGRALHHSACRYCGQTLEPGQNACPHCGAPGRSARR